MWQKMQLNICFFDIFALATATCWWLKDLVENEQPSAKTSGRISILAWVAEPSKLCGDAFKASGATFDHSGILLGSARFARLGIQVCQNAVDISETFATLQSFEACAETQRPIVVRGSCWLTEGHTE